MAYIPYTISREHKERKMDKFTVEFYEKENGDIPVEEFLDGFKCQNESKVGWPYRNTSGKGNF